MDVENGTLPKHGQRIARLLQDDPWVRVVPHPEPPGFALEVPLLPLRQALEKVASEIQAELPKAVVEVRDGNIWVDDEPVGLLGPSDKWRHVSDGFRDFHRILRLVVMLAPSPN